MKEKDLLFYIKVLDKKICEDFDSRLEKWGLTSQQGRILFFVYRLNKCENVLVHQSDIESHFHLSKSTVSGLVNRLINNGFIKKVDGTRYPTLEPTEKGIEVIDNIHKSREITLERLLTGVDEAERKQIENGLKMLIRNMGGNVDEGKY